MLDSVVVREGTCSVAAVQGDGSGGTGQVDLREVANGLGSVSGEHEGFNGDEMVVALRLQALLRQLVSESDERHGERRHDCANSDCQRCDEKKIHLEGQRIGARPFFRHELIIRQANRGSNDGNYEFRLLARSVSRSAVLSAAASCKSAQPQSRGVPPPACSPGVQTVAPRVAAD